MEYEDRERGGAGKGNWLFFFKFSCDFFKDDVKRRNKTGWKKKHKTNTFGTFKIDCMFIYIYIYHLLNNRGGEWEKLLLSFVIYQQCGFCCFASSLIGGEVFEIVFEERKWGLFEGIAYHYADSQLNLSSFSY